MKSSVPKCKDLRFRFCVGFLKLDPALKKKNLSQLNSLYFSSLLQIPMWCSCTFSVRPIFRPPTFTLSHDSATEPHGGCLFDRFLEAICPSLPDPPKLCFLLLCFQLFHVLLAFLHLNSSTTCVFHYC